MSYIIFTAGIHMSDAKQVWITFFYKVLWIAGFVYDFAILPVMRASNLVHGVELITAGEGRTKKLP